MANFWIFNMGRSAKSGDSLPQTMYRLRAGASLMHDSFEYNRSTLVPAKLDLWEKVACSDPWGYDKGASPDWLVGRYGYWWGAQWSGGRICGFDGVGPADCPFIDALDQVALSHDIECWLAAERQHNPKLDIQSGDQFRVENTYHEGGQIGPQVFPYKDDTYPHTHAFMRLKALPLILRQRLKKSVVLYTILQSEEIQAGGAAQFLRYRYDTAVKGSLMLLGLAHVKVSQADLLECLDNPRADSLSLTAPQCGRLKALILQARQGGGDARLREVLAMLER